jgi:hypothetical protein
MIRAIVDSRLYLTLILTLGIGSVLNQRIPFPEDDAILQLILAEKPVVFLAIKYAYQTILFSTPFIGCSMLFSLLYIFFVRSREIEALSHCRHTRPSPSATGYFSSSASFIIPSAQSPRNNPGGLRFPKGASTRASPSSAPLGPARPVVASILSPSRSSGTMPAIKRNVRPAWCSKSKATFATRCGRS